MKSVNDRWFLWELAGLITLALVAGAGIVLALVLGQ